MALFSGSSLSGWLTGLWTGLFVLWGSTNSGNIAFAQVTPDGTLSTTVTSTGNNFAIDNGDRVGNNLFHSFSRFSVPTGGSASFNNAGDIQTIFSRVTGGSISNIDGLIQANGTANLFLLNPSGILFGPNASLNIGGSFVGTTANSIKFSGGVEFSAVNPTAPSLLTMSVPIGLQMGSNPGSITVQGRGHTLNNRSVPFTGSMGTAQLSVQPGRTLALVGGDITLNGGVLMGEAGAIELGAIGADPVRPIVLLNPTPTGWSFDYGAVPQFASIQLLGRSLVSASGLNPGSIHLSASNLTVAEGSLALIENRGTSKAGDLVVQAADTVTVKGLSANNQTFSSLVNYTRSSGDAGDVWISARQVLVRDRAEIRSTTTSTGNAGDVIIRASDLVQLDNSIADSSGFAQGIAGIFSTTFSTGNAGTLDIATRQLRILPGGTVNGVTFGRGTGGTIQITATESVEVIGTKPNIFGSASINVNAGASGNAGNLTVNTRRLTVKDGGFIGAAAAGTGQGGTVTLNADEFISITGARFNPVTNGPLPSQISVSVRRTPATAPFPTANSGSAVINTSRLELDAQGQIVLLNEGVGRGGTLVVNADSLILDNQSRISASTNSGKGGDITLNLQDLLVMRRGSLINAEAGGSDNLGGGGNITINAPIIAGFENSDIIATAVQGRGGRISITTQGIIGLVFRNTLTPKTDLTNDITTSSQFNVNGTVQIKTIDFNPNSGLVTLPAAVTDPSQQIAQGCVAHQNSSFVITGRGGLPPNPMTQTGSDRPWTDTRNLSPSRSSPITATPQPAISPPLVEATGWRRNPKGDVEVYATPTPSLAATIVTCAPWTP